MKKETKTKTKSGPDADHAKRGPSALRAIELCAAFENHDKTHDAADEGTLAHDYLEHNLLKHDNQALQKFTDDMQGHIHKVWDYMNETFLERVSVDEDGKEDWIPAEEIGQHIFYEKKLDLSAAKIPGCDKGTIDIVYFPDGDLTYCKAGDYKFGFIEVDDAEINIQGWMYCVGLWLAYPSLDQIDFEFFQPKANMITRATFYRKDMERFINRAYMIVRRAQQLKKPCTPNTAYCRYCKKMPCAAALKQFQQFAKSLAVECPADSKWQNRLQNNDAAGDIFRFCKSIEKLAKSVCDGISNEFKEGKLEVSGHKLKIRKGSTTVIDPVGLEEFVLENFDITPEEFKLTMKPGMGALCALIREGAPRGEKKDAEKEFKQQLEDEAYTKVGTSSSWLEAVK